MTKLQKLKEKLPFSFILKANTGYSIDGLVFIDDYFTKYHLKNSEKFFYLDFENVSHIEELLNNSIYPKVLPENYHMSNNLGKFSDSDLYFLVAGENVKIGVSTDVDIRIENLKTSMPCEFEAYYIERKGFLEKTMHHAFSDFHKKGEWFQYNARFEKFIKSNALRVNQSQKEIAPHIKPYVLGFGAYNGQDIKELIHIDNKYCQTLVEHKTFPDKIRRFIKFNKK